MKKRKQKKKTVSETDEQGIPAHLEAEAAGPPRTPSAQPNPAAPSATPSTSPTTQSAAPPANQPLNLFQVCLEFDVFR